MVRAFAALFAAAALAVPATAAAATPPIKHVFVIVLENHEFADTFGLGGQLLAPYFNRTLVPDGQLLTQYYGTGHSSADNYIAMVSGQPPTPAAQDDCPNVNGTGDPQRVPRDAQPPYNIAVGDGCLYPDNFLTVGDQLTAKGLTWKSYNQDIPSACFLGSSYLPKDGRMKGDYRRKHSPFVLFDSIRQSPQCEQNVVGLPTPEQLRATLSSDATAPNFSYIVPNQCDDGHDACAQPAPPVPLGADPLTGSEVALTQIDDFLKRYVPPIIESPVFKKDGLLVITFDEAVESLACCNEQPGPATSSPGGDIPPGSGGGNSGAVVISPFIKPGASDPAHMLNATAYNHYSLLRSIEDIFGVSHLGYAGVDGLAPFGPDVYTGAP